MDLLTFACISCICVVSLIVKYMMRTSHDQTCYVLNYQCYKPTDDRKLNADIGGNIIIRNKNLDLDDAKFMLKTLVRSKISEETYVSRNIIEAREDSTFLSDAIGELDEFFFDAIGKLLNNSHMSPSQIDVLVVNVSMFSSVPSLAARIINHYKMRDDIKVYNLSGMGCSASIVSMGIVKDVLKSMKNGLAMVVSSESIAPNWYRGRDKSMMIPNLLFRSGGCAILLTNNPNLRDKAKFKLNYLVRVHIGSDDEAYKYAMKMDDENGNAGVHISKSLPEAAAKAFSMNLKRLIPKILPLQELLRFAIASSISNVMNHYDKQTIKNSNSSSTVKINFKSGVDHFCIHPGGTAVINGVGNSMGLNEHDLEPARMALRRFGNTSASGIWYVLGYMEAKRRLKKGEKVLIAGFGAGFKCNTCVLEVVRDLDLEEQSVWKDCIGEYPINDLASNAFGEVYKWLESLGEDYLSFNADNLQKLMREYYKEKN
ncbi:hypothetical protein Scep_015732 [Stephania cephalantha]|uniref:3-ketoacyl-CoA synthase n=1 Tax=Stephania cephalantha TaxID=152367 RepID=A0AAP0J647_9MAGN